MLLGGDRQHQVRREQHQMEAACQSVARSVMTVRVPTTTEMKSDTWWVGPRPSKSRPSCQIAAMATAGMVRPMLAMSEP